MILLSQSLHVVLALFQKVIVIKNRHKIDEFFILKGINFVCKLGKIRMFLSQSLSTEVMHPVPAEVEALVFQDGECVSWVPGAPLAQIRDTESVKLRR